MKRKMNKNDIIKQVIYAGGGAERVEKQHLKGKMTARERIQRMFDKNTFVEYNIFTTGNTAEDAQMNGDGVVTGIGRINGRKICLYAQDFTVDGGTIGRANAKKIVAIQELAMKLRVPIIALIDSGGARIQEGVQALSGYGEIFKNNVKASGVIPQISAIMGPCAGGAAYSPALTDFIFMVEDTSCMFVTGPDVIQTVTGEAIDKNTLGGTGVHMKKSGVAHFCCKNDEECIDKVRRLLEYLPDNAETKPGIKKYRYNSQIDVEALVPSNKRNVYNMYALLEAIFDENSLMEIQAEYAPNILIFLATMKGITVGIVANQPRVLAGSLDINACDKASRFINFCSLFQIPILTFVDVPGYLPGKEQERNGIIRHGAKMLYAYNKSQVPKMTLIIRKAYGGAYLGMCSKEIGADYVVAWPEAEVAVMGAEGAINILERNNIKKAENEEEYIQNKIEAYKNEFLNPYYAARLGYIDDVINPNDTRETIYNFLATMQDKRVDRMDAGNFPV